MKKILSVILLILSLVLVSACASDNTAESDDPANENNPNDNASLENGQENSESPTEEEYPSLPDKDTEGFELRFYNYDNSQVTWSVNELSAEEETGDPVLDEIYRRNRRIEEKYNCVIIETAVPNTVDTFRNLMRAGDDLYDIAQLYDDRVASFYIENLLLSWEQLPHIELDAPWWMRDANRVFSLNGKQFAAVGAHSLAMYSRGFALLFNKDMYADLGITDNLYGLVREGKWTVDKFAEVAKQAISDLNGDGVMDKDDRYGVSGAVKLHFGSLVTGAGVKYIENDEEGNPFFAIPGNVYALEAMQKIFGLHDGNDIYYKIGRDIHSGTAETLPFFENEQILFAGVSTQGIGSYRGFESDIGILPYPKLNEQQENHYTLTSGTGISTLPVTIAPERLENIGFLIEVLARDSYGSVLPAYKETTLKTKLARDNESADMIDIIFGSLTFDLGLSVFPGDTYYMYMENYFKMDNAFASTTERIADRAAAAIEKLMDATQ